MNATLLLSFLRKNWLKILVALSSAHFISLFAKQSIYSGIPISDTRFVIAGAYEAIQCYSLGAFQCAGLSTFPLFQYLSASWFLLTGFTQEATILELIQINQYSFYAILLLSGWYFYRKNLLAFYWIFVSAFVSSGLLWYGISSFNEMTAAFITLVFVYVCLKKSNAFWILFWFVLAGSTKEIAFIFLVLLALGAWGQDLIKKPKAYIPQLAGLGAGSVLSFAINSAFNYSRYGSIFNLANMNQELHVPTLAIHANFFAGLLVGLNTGVLFYAFFFCVIIIGIWILVLKKPFALWREKLAYSFPALIVMAVLFGLTLGLSKWYAPYGWVGWGPRLMLPWLPACSFLLMAVYPREMKQLVLFLFKSKLRLALSLSILIYFALPQLGVLYGWDVYGQFFQSDPDCPRMAVIQKDPDFYYQCVSDKTWSRHNHILINMIDVLKLSHVKPFLHSFIVAFIGLIWLSRRAILDEPDSKAIAAKKMSPLALVITAGVIVASGSSLILFIYTPYIGNAGNLLLCPKSTLFKQNLTFLGSHAKEIGSGSLGVISGDRACYDKFLAYPSPKSWPSPSENLTQLGENPSIVTDCKADWIFFEAPRKKNFSSSIYLATAESYRLVDTNFESLLLQSQCGTGSKQAQLDAKSKEGVLQLDGNPIIGKKAASVFIPQEFEIHAVVTPQGHQADHANIVGNHPGYFDRSGFVIQQDAHHQNRFVFGFGDGNNWSKAVSFNLVAEQKNNLLIRVEKSKIKLFLEGKLIVDQERTTKLRNTLLPVVIGNFPFGKRPFSGIIHEIQIRPLPK